MVTAAAVMSLAACQSAPAARQASVSAPPGPVVAGASVPVVAHPDPLSLVHNDDPALEADKRVVFDMWRTVLNAGHQEAADDFVAEDYIQHSPFQRSGREALKQTFSVIPRRDEIPEVMSPPLVAFVAEGGLVLLVAVETLPEPEGEGRYVTTHFNLFRVEDGQVVEHWHPDATPPCPDLPSAEEGGPQPVQAATGRARLALLEAATPDLAANKRVVFDFTRHVVDGDRAAAARALDEHVVEHNPTGASALHGAAVTLAGREDMPFDTSLERPLVAFVAEGDLVAQVLKVELPNPYSAGDAYTTVWIDLYRIADGRIAEHWDAALKPGTDVVEMGSACGAGES